MSSKESGRPPEAPRSHAGAIVAVAIVSLGVIWTYIFFGKTALGWWAKGGATVVILAAMIAAWIWRRRRTSQQIELLQRWADHDEARGQRKPARRS